MSKFNFEKTIATVQKSYRDDKRRAMQFGLGDALSSISNNPDDYVVLPEWFKNSFGVLGIPIGKWIEISGRPDSGKSSFCLLTMKAAQDQGYGIVYVETEGKSSKEDLLSVGLDLAGIMTVQTNITEEVYEGINRNIDAFFDDYPKDKLLLVIDSYGNTTSMRDSEIDLTEKGVKVGGASQINRLGLGSIQARMKNHPIACLIVNYSYANMNAPGETNAGGRVLEYFSSLVIQASRRAWVEKTIKGQKVRAGADVLWKTTKNHFVKALEVKDNSPVMLPKEILLRITADGMKIMDKSLKEDGSEENA